MEKGPITMDNVGLLIRRLRLAKDLTQGALADRAAVSASQISQIETGDSRPSRKTLVRIARALDAPEILLAALQRSVVLHEALAMLGISQTNSKVDPHALADRICEEMAALKKNFYGEDAPAKAGAIADMCRTLTLLLAARAYYCR